MRDRNWAMVLGVLCGLATAFIALLADVTESSFLLRTGIGILVGVLVGLGLDALFVTARSVSEPRKGSMVDFTLNEANPADSFVPLDYQKAARVVRQTARDE